MKIPSHCLLSTGMFLFPMGKILPCSFFCTSQQHWDNLCDTSGEILTSFPCWRSFPLLPPPSWRLHSLFPPFPWSHDPKLVQPPSPAPRMVFDVPFSCSFCPLGIKDADKAELGRIASDPISEHVLHVEDSQLLPKVAPKLSRRLCFTASEPPRPVRQRVQGESGFSFDPQSLWLCFHGDGPPTPL